jgi:3'-5' exoribonuclease
MKRQFVNTLQEGDYLNDYFVATRKDLRSKQSGGHFLGMVFKDRTGEVGGILWNNAVEVADLFEPGDVVSVRGQVNTYQNRLQIRVEQISPLREGEFAIEDLVNAPGDAKADVEALKEILDTIEQPHLKQVIAAFWADQDFMSRFATAAAAKKWHHEYRGGLARHCYEMARLALTMCELYPELDRDVLLAGVFLHDLGKLTEMTHDLFVDYTNEGKLVGHLQVGCDMFQEKARAVPGFPDPLRLHILHLILSHHGELVHGSPVLPKSLEAIVLHHIDNLDAQAAAVSRIVRETRERRQEWSDYIQLIDRVIWARPGA